DEPSAGLAPLMVDSIFETVKTINDAGVAILMVEQNARKSLELADRGYVLATGTNQVEGSGTELLANPDIARLYLGGPCAGSRSRGKPVAGAPFPSFHEQPRRRRHRPRGADCDHPDQRPADRCDQSASAVTAGPRRDAGRHHRAGSSRTDAH